MPTDRRGRRLPPPRFDHGRPIATLGLAPFAGVLLTMTLVFAALRPPVIHAVTVDLPVPLPPDFGPPLSPPTNRLSIDRDGTARWNAVAVSDRTLATILVASRDIAPQPVLLFDPAPDASYERSLRVLGVVHRAGLVDGCFRFADPGRYRRYEIGGVDRAAQAAPRVCDFALD